MNKFIATLLLVAVTFHSATAFTTTRGTRTLSTRGQKTASIVPAFEVPTTTAPIISTTALQALKIKVDPKAKGNTNDKGNAKMVAYGGSVAFAVLLF